MDDRELTVGEVRMPARRDVPWSEDPNAIVGTIAGLMGAPGLARAGLGMLGSAARAIDPAERMFRAAGGLGMLGGAGSASADGAAKRGWDEHTRNAKLQELRTIQERLKDANSPTLQQDHQRRLELLQDLGLPQSREYRAEAPGMLQQIARAPAPRPSGAGDRRDKKLRDAEERDTRAG